MTRNKKALPGASPKGRKCSADGRGQRVQLQDTTPTDNPQVFDAKAYGRTVRRACSDAYVLLKDFPVKVRFSYFVDRTGCLRSLSSGEVPK